MPKAGSAAPSASPATGIGPATKDDCAKGGWAQFKDQKFKGEAECVAFVEKHEKSK
jgi:molybdopterin-biosynthesis enzyme MoeA-like protein